MKDLIEMAYVIDLNRDPYDPVNAKDRAKDYIRGSAFVYDDKDARLKVSRWLDQEYGPEARHIFIGPAPKHKKNAVG